MASKVYFVNLRTRSDKNNKINKLKNLFDRAGLNELIKPNDLTAIKLHFGERGNDSYINPVFVRQVVDKVKAYGGKPFLTDTNTLYSGSRHNAVDHLTTALEHGFDYTVTGAPLVIADGLKSENVAAVAINRKHFATVKLARDLVSADSMIVMSHFKGHEMAGFGGAIKNLGMGGAPAVGKKEQHATKLVVDAAKCVGCAKCSTVCPEAAIAVAGKKAGVDVAKCIGCGECMTVCPQKAVGMKHGTDYNAFVERLTEYGSGLAKAHAGRIGYINFLLNITPDCDCVPWSDAAIVPDIGFLASIDPVAIDQASVDLVNKMTGLPESFLTRNCEAGADKFHGLRTHVDGLIQLRYGEEIGLGSREYELITL